MGYKPTPTPAIGGTVLAILNRHRLRSKAMDTFRDARANFKPPTAWIGDIPVSVKSQEAYTLEADVTEHAVESGAIFSDHVILRPLKLDLSFEVTNWEPGAARYAYELLNQLYQNREPVDLLTEHRVLRNLILVRLDMTNSLPNWGSLVVRATFKELKLVTLETAQLSPENVTPTDDTGGPNTPKASEEPKDSGQVSLVSRVVDTVKDLFK